MNGVIMLSACCFDEVIEDGFLYAGGVYTGLYTCTKCKEDCDLTWGVCQ